MSSVYDGVDPARKFENFAWKHRNPNVSVTEAQRLQRAKRAEVITTRHDNDDLQYFPQLQFSAVKATYSLEVYNRVLQVLYLREGRSAFKHMQQLVSVGLAEA